MKDIYIVAAKRTPFGKYRGFFKDASAVDMGVMALKGTLKASGINPEDVQALFMGNVLETGLGENMARQVALYSGMNFINKEDKDNPEKMTSTMLNDGLMDAFSGKHMGITAENVAEKYNVSREEMDKFSLASHQKAAKATEAGLLKNEILDVEIDGQVLEHDEPIRPGTSLEALGNLKPVFKEDGQVTAGNASPLTDGASMVILATKEKMEELDLTPVAKLGDFAEAGFDPAYMGYTPYFAVKKLLAKTGRSINDYDLIELNEAFAAQSIPVARDLEIPMDKLNIMGGAISLGHPLGATGTRLISTAVNGLKNNDGKLALVTLCIGGGQAIAYEIENV